MKIHSLSASKIKAFKQCEFKYYLEYHLFRDTGTSFAAEQGNLVHVIFEKMGEDIRDGKNLNDSHIFNKWYEEVLFAYADEGLWKLSPDVSTQLKECISCQHHLDGICELTKQPIDKFEGCPKPQFDDALWLVRKIISYPKILWPLDQKIIDVEDRFQLKIADGNNEIKVNGIIDVVTEIDKETIEIVDYKSGKYIQSYNECTKDPQLLIYHLAARDRWHQYKNIMITMYYLRKKPLTLSFGAKEEVGTENAIKHYFHVIANNESPKRRCDKFGGQIHYDYVCEKMCNIKLCKKEFTEFKENSHKILPAPENPPKHRKEWLKRLTQDSKKENTFKETKNGNQETKKTAPNSTETDSTTTSSTEI